MELDPETVATLDIAIAAMRCSLDRAEAVLEEIRRRRIVHEFRQELEGRAS